MIIVSNEIVVKLNAQGYFATFEQRLNRRREFSKERCTPDPAVGFRHIRRAFEITGRHALPRSCAIRRSTFCISAASETASVTSPTLLRTRYKYILDRPKKLKSPVQTSTGSEDAPAIINVRLVTQSHENGS